MLIVRAPLRISIGGGGTDLPSYSSLYGGEWISAAIDKYVYLIVHERFDDIIRVCYSKTEEVKNVEDIQHPILREVLKFVKIKRGIEVFSAADIPSCTGLGGSGSFTVGLLHALYSFSKKTVPSKKELSEQACHIVIDLLKEPSGKQDEYISAFGGLSSFQASKTGQVKVESLKVPNELDNNLLLFYTGIRRESKKVLKIQKESINKKEKEMTNNLHKTKEIGKKIKKAIQENNLDYFGELLDLHWQEKLKRKGTSNSKIENWYNIAKKNGAMSGKIVGAGGGGFFLFYCKDQKDKLRKAMSECGLKECPFHFDFEGVKLIYDQ